MSQLPRVGFRPVENDVLECFESPRCIRPGADIEIIRLVFKLMGEDFELVNVEKEFNLGFDFGSLVNGSWTGVMGLLIEDKLDMFGVNMRTTVDRSRDVLFSYPIKMFQSVLLIKPPCDTIENNFVFKGFATTVWILLCITFFTIIFVNILFYLVEQRISGWRTDKINIRMIDSAAMKTFLPLRTCSRFHRNVLYAAVLPCLFFILQMYQMKMYSFLATNLGFVIPFHTMDKAIEAVSNGDYFFAGFTYPLLSPAMDAKFKKAIEKNPFHFAKSTAEAQDLIASSTAVYQSVLDSDILPGDVSWLFKDQQILVIRDEMSQGYYAAYAFSKKNKKLRDRFNSALMYLLPAVGHISTGHGYASRKIKYESSQAKLIYLSLTTHMAQLFKCYLIGIALSVSAFAIESLFYLIYRLRTTKRRTSMLVDAKLSNGSHMPFVGLGTGGKRCEPELTRKMLHTALDVGYRHIDTAALYSTEEIIGEVIEEYINSGKLKRSDLFITTKLSPINNHPDRVEEALNRQLAKLRTDYVDMYLIHTPISMKDKGSYHMDLSQIQSYEYDLVNLVDIWHEMEKLCESGKAKSIGVSNFSERQIETLIDGAKKYKPMNNQIEVHLHFPQKELVEFCQRNNIVVTAYAPIGCPSKKSEEKFGWPSEVAVDDPAVIALAEKYERTPAQILLRQLIHRGIVVIPKSTNEERLKQNLDVFDFKLTAEELNVLDAIPPRSRLYKFVGQVDHPDFPFPDIIAARKSGLI